MTFARKWTGLGEQEGSLTDSRDFCNIKRKMENDELANQLMKRVKDGHQKGSKISHIEM